MDRIEKLKDFLQKNPQDDFIQHALALEYIKIGREEDAYELFINLLERSPSYIGSYYHLGKLLERKGDNDAAVVWYEKGMTAAKAEGDQHAYNELHAAYEDLIY